MRRHLGQDIFNPSPRPKIKPKRIGWNKTFRTFKRTMRHRVKVKWKGEIVKFLSFSFEFYFFLKKKGRKWNEIACVWVCKRGKKIFVFENRYLYRILSAQIFPAAVVSSSPVAKGTYCCRIWWFGNFRSRASNRSCRIWWQIVGAWMFHATWGGMRPLNLKKLNFSC